MAPCTPPLELADRQKIFDGSDPVKMHNYYTYLYNQTVHDVISAKKGEKETVLFARSATAGGQKFPVHWGDSLLVAPIFNDQSMAEFICPRVPGHPSSPARHARAANGTGRSTAI